MLGVGGLVARVLTRPYPIVFGRSIWRSRRRERPAPGTIWAMAMSAESMIFGALKSVGVVQRESFTLASFDPETGRRNGSVSAQEVAAELISCLDLCRAHGITACAECGQDAD